MNEMCVSKETYLKLSPPGPTTTTLPPQPNTRALSPHHSILSGLPRSSSIVEISTSDMFLWKSAETTHKMLDAVMRARKRPLGDRRIWENGPRDRRYLSALVALSILGLREKLTWSIRSNASRVIIVVPVDTNISVWPDVDCSGEMIVHE
jgi:hypothetical protein